MQLHLSILGPNEGARKEKRRLGRGESSGRGKTSGKGGKGQTARTGGKVHPYFEGGQMPLYRRVPKVGFISRKKVLGLNNFKIISLSDLETFEAKADVNPETLAAKGFRCSSKFQGGIKLLASGTLTKPLTVRVHAVSDAARMKVEAVGGKVEILEKSSVKPLSK